MLGCAGYYWVLKSKSVEDLNPFPPKKRLEPAPPASEALVSTSYSMKVRARFTAWGGGGFARQP
jgi:hypothetical protein